MAVHGRRIVTPQSRNLTNDIPKLKRDSEARRPVLEVMDRLREKRLNRRPRVLRYNRQG